MQQLSDIVAETDYTAGQAAERCGWIYDYVLETSPTLDGANFSVVGPADLQRLFVQYDELFFKAHLKKTLASRRLTFRFSKRMTSAGGKTTQYVRRRDGVTRFEITLSSALLFHTFRTDDHRPIIVNGLKCHDRLQALQRIMEHELIHLCEMLLWNESSCSKPRFQSISSRFFGHTEHQHQLITFQERAQVRHGIAPGSLVRFHYRDAAYEGVVNRITKRATVLVLDEHGEAYSDGKRYRTFYVPLDQLEPRPR